MTIKELYSLRSIEKEIQFYEYKIAELRESATKITANLGGMPHGTGISDKVGKSVAAIMELLELCENAKEQRINEETKITQYILSVDDSLVRQIMNLRFIQGKSWNAIAMNIGGNNTADGVRMRLKRYLKQNETCSFCSSQKDKIIK